MAIITFRSNDALNINPPSGDQHLTVNGSDWLWTVLAIYAFSFIVVVLHSFVARASEKVFHYIYGIALLVGSIAYFSMASDFGWVAVTNIENTDFAATRQMFYAKFINWVVLFPAVALALGLVSGVSWATILYHICLAWTWVIAYLATSVVGTTYKWGYYVVGTVVWILLATGTIYEGFRSARRVGILRDYAILAGWANLLWLLYPIAFAISDAGNVIGVTASFIFFGILDVLLIPGLTFATLLLVRNWDYNKLNLVFTQYGRIPIANGDFAEKAQAPPAAPVAGLTA